MTTVESLERDTIPRTDAARGLRRALAEARQTLIRMAGRVQTAMDQIDLISMPNDMDAKYGACYQTATEIRAIDTIIDGREKRRARSLAYHVTATLAALQNLDTLLLTTIYPPREGET